MYELNNPLLENIPCLRRYARALTNNNRLADRAVQQCVDCAVDLQKLVIVNLGNAAERKIWMFSIFHNIYGEFIKEQESIGHQLNVDLSDNEVVTINPDNHFDNDEHCIALMQLPLLQRQIFLLVSIEKFRYEEVARIVNLPLGAVLSLLHTARQSIAERVYAVHAQVLSGEAKDSDNIEPNPISAENDDAFKDRLEEIF